MDKLLYTGKVKQMWSTNDPEVLRVVYTDQATAGNGKKKDNFKDKAELNNQISTLIFQYLEKNGVPTHFIKKISDKEELVKKCEMFPLEVVTRNIAAGHFSSRYGLDEGMRFAIPVEELFFKSDELDDPILNSSDAVALNVATKSEQEQMWSLSRQVNQLLINLFDEAGMDLVDFKLEFGKLHNGQIVLADEFSPDNCRLWDKKTKSHMDKDVYRRDIGDLTAVYKKVLARIEEVLEED
ncbi:phosphoribosylaminoimidazolesuccinocarboxamide synthase [Lactobacillus kefiranofaciens]|uniref:Phosphoribosylaminoimidazole-succinocarboxamide synthase n=1 Tax=Lactobacillus kefiranofaciens TaxID=267818 RepID=A0AAX3UCC0_9LACO|nr:phosphoribosylaminoimidazolesuccinocarboxamide synthase [Lactobacillus kefiranofaciens]AEG41234.1 Phosphoribosylaminoimidazole-succinocarboxamide synthase [Lactobacillus kefiranofaciens subsp. kefiranofaciens]KRL29895.1 phosphoribosylaminoimidazole-succinocarboxamide synthase [Lactobacillus kefiranofaciens subsp. kefirgranum DSM 10550 = JCM 8572]KRM21555.1 phosphoribosylaminoimidazole-succinocarboxamide synthase [Lactobacillus kefiranofaciens subsp. kefiranofaciens DSM 5016 = JCM 6985]MCJ217